MGGRWDRLLAVSYCVLRFGSAACGSTVLHNLNSATALMCVQRACLSHSGIRKEVILGRQAKVTMLNLLEASDLPI